jgi:transketolase
MRNAYVATLYDLAEANKQVMALVADIGALVFDKFRADFPGRFINFGVAESNIIATAAGMASCGKIPFTYTIIPFLTMRTYEQIRDDVCLQKANVKIVGVGAGLVYSTLGPTHHALEDIAIMKTLPNMTIISPADPLEARKATIKTAEIEGPVYLRLGTSGEPEVYQHDYDFTVGRGVKLKEGEDAAIIATGSIVYDALQAANELEKENISVRLINIHTIKPIDKEIILQAASETGAILTVEEHNIEGGFGSSVASVILEANDIPVKFKRLGVNDNFCSYYGTHQELKNHCGLSQKDIIRGVKYLLSKKNLLKGN